MADRSRSREVLTPLFNHDGLDPAEHGDEPCAYHHSISFSGSSNVRRLPTLLERRFKSCRSVAGLSVETIQDSSRENVTVVEDTKPEFRGWFFFDKKAIAPRGRVPEQNSSQERKRRHLSPSSVAASSRANSSVLSAFTIPELTGEPELPGAHVVHDVPIRQVCNSSSLSPSVQRGSIAEQAEERDPLAADDTVRLMSYNILAQRFVSTDRYPSCPLAALSEDYRSRLIHQEIKAIAPDIIGFQEMSMDCFEYHGWLGESLRREHGFDGCHVSVTDRKGTPRCFPGDTIACASEKGNTTAQSKPAQPDSDMEGNEFSGTFSRGTEDGSRDFMDLRERKSNGAMQRRKDEISSISLGDAGRSLLEMIGPVDDDMQHLLGASDCASPSARRKKRRPPTNSILGMTSSLGGGGGDSAGLAPLLSPEACCTMFHGISAVAATSTTSEWIGHHPSEDSSTHVDAHEARSEQDCKTSPLPKDHADVTPLRRTSSWSSESGGISDVNRIIHHRYSGGDVGKCAEPKLCESPSFPRRTEMDGVAVFFRRERFEFVEHYPVRFNLEAQMDEALPQRSKKKVQSTSHNVGLITVLRDRRLRSRAQGISTSDQASASPLDAATTPAHNRNESARAPSLSAAQPMSSVKYSAEDEDIAIIATVHLLWEREECQLWQMRTLLNHVENVRRKYESLPAGRNAQRKVWHAVLGDFNAESGSAAVRFALEGKLSTESDVRLIQNFYAGVSPSCAPLPAEPIQIQKNLSFGSLIDATVASEASETSTTPRGLSVVTMEAAVEGVPGLENKPAMAPFNTCALSTPPMFNAHPSSSSSNPQQHGVEHEGTKDVRHTRTSSDTLEYDTVNGSLTLYTPRHVSSAGECGNSSVLDSQASKRPSKFSHLLTGLSETHCFVESPSAPQEMCDARTPCKRRNPGADVSIDGSSDVVSLPGVEGSPSTSVDARHVPGHTRGQGDHSHSVTQTYSPTHSANSTSKTLSHSSESQYCHMFSVGKDGIVKCLVKSMPPAPSLELSTLHGRSCSSMLSITSPEGGLSQIVSPKTRGELGKVYNGRLTKTADLTAVDRSEDGNLSVHIDVADAVTAVETTEDLTGRDQSSFSTTNTESRSPNNSHNSSGKEKIVSPHTYLTHSKARRGPSRPHPESPTNTPPNVNQFPRLLQRDVARNGNANGVYPALRAKNGNGTLPAIPPTKKSSGSPSYTSSEAESLENPVVGAPRRTPKDSHIGVYQKVMENCSVQPLSALVSPMTDEGSSKGSSGRGSALPPKRRTLPQVPSLTAIDASPASKVLDDIIRGAHSPSPELPLGFAGLTSPRIMDTVVRGARIRPAKIPLSFSSPVPQPLPLTTIFHDFENSSERANSPPSVQLPSFKHSLCVDSAYVPYCKIFPRLVSAVNPSSNGEGKVLDHILFDANSVECVGVLHLGKRIDLPSRVCPSDHYPVCAVLRLR